MTRARFLAFACLLALAAPRGAAADAPGEIALPTEAVPVDAAPTGEPPRAVQVAKAFDLVDRPPPSPLAKPSLPGVVRYGEVQAVGRFVSVAAIKNDPSGLTVLADANGDGTLDPATESVAAAPGPASAKSASWTVSPWILGGVPLSLTVTERSGQMTANVVATKGLRGKAVVDGVAYGFFLLDDDLDGRYGSPGDLWWFGPLDAFAAKPTKNYSVLFEGNEACFASGKTWRLASVAADGTAHVTPAPPVDAEAYLHRRSERVNKTMWFPKFDAEKVEFLKKWSVDPARPKVLPPAWHYALDLDAALSIASKEGKPLLVDFEADWCVWCKRIDYYAYVDAEVAGWLGKFACVKVNYELDEKRSIDRFGWGKLPAVACIDAKGRPVKFDLVERDSHGADKATPGAEFLPGWCGGPDKFAANLKAVYEAWARGGR